MQEVEEWRAMADAIAIARFGKPGVAALNIQHSLWTLLVVALAAGSSMQEFHTCLLAIEPDEL